MLCGFGPVTYLAPNCPTFLKCILYNIQNVPRVAYYFSIFLDTVDVCTVFARLLFLCTVYHTLESVWIEVVVSGSKLLSLLPYLLTIANTTIATTIASTNTNVSILHLILFYLGLLFTMQLLQHCWSFFCRFVEIFVYSATNEMLHIFFKLCYP